MTMIGNETLLPGVITEVESDYSFGYDSSQFGSTDSELIIGTAFSGPVGVPVEVYSPEHGRYLFGKAYDAKTKQEATLVAGIEDAYQRGCRTIYAIRISGKHLQKSFDFSLDTTLKLRVAGLFPSNAVKDYFMVYDDTEGDEKIKLYKPSSRATIIEKMQGLVESDNSVLVTEIRINRDYGMTKDTKLVDLARIVNEHRFNNTLRLSIVDASGADVTVSSMEAQNMPIGALLPGAYLLGRNKSLCVSTTDIDYVLVQNEAQKPFPSFEDILYKRLILNTDVSASVPIFAKDFNMLRTILREVEVFMFSPFDFLETPGVIDRAFKKDNVDYEEVNITNFEIYKRLGSGFAITARADRRVDGAGKELVPRVKETPVSDTNRVLPISDGMYSMLENLNARYRVLFCGNADDHISGRLPRPSDFLVTSAIGANIFSGLITATPVVAIDNRESAKKYRFSLHAYENPTESLISDIYTQKIFKIIPSVNSEEALHDVVVPNGTFVMLLQNGVGTLKCYNENAYQVVNDETLVDDMFIVNNRIFKGVNGIDGTTFVELDESEFGAVGLDATLYGKKYILAENNGRVFAFKVVGDTANHVLALGDIRTMLSENKDKTLVFAQSNHFEENPVIIRSAILDGITLEEFVDLLNNHDSLKGVFTFAISPNAIANKDDYVSDVVTGLGDIYVLTTDRQLVYDYSKYIPYKTNDNFARQLAQHCTYTSLKTAPTHGVIGMTRLADLTLSSIANKVEELLNLELDLYAKNAQGRNMLDRNNMPYPIGKNISVVFGQYMVNMDDGYRFISNGAAGYGGMVSQLPLDQSSTSQPIALNNNAFELTNYQLTRLTQKGYITFRQSYTRGYVVTDGITMAPAASPFRRLSVTRVIGAVEELIRAAVEPYIGKQNHAANRNSMQTAIKSNLDKLVGQLIEDYDFNMVVDPRIMKFSYIDIDYRIIPVYEIREVRNRISVRDEL